MIAGRPAGGVESTGFGAARQMLECLQEEHEVEAMLHVERQLGYLADRGYLGSGDMLAGQ
jgi:hypothetical protein